MTYDPARVSYDDLLKVFWDNHNPTTLNRQGWDIGTQYRSAIFFHAPEQEAAGTCVEAKLEASGRYRQAHSNRNRAQPPTSTWPRTTTSSTWRSVAYRPAIFRRPSLKGTLTTDDGLNHQDTKSTKVLLF